MQRIVAFARDMQFLSMCRSGTSSDVASKRKLRSAGERSDRQVHFERKAVVTQITNGQVCGSYGETSEGQKIVRYSRHATQSFPTALHCRDRRLKLRLPPAFPSTAFSTRPQ